MPSLRFIHGLYEAAQRSTANISSLVTSYHTFFRFIMARLLHSEEFADMDEHGIVWARVAMECLLTTELYPVYKLSIHIQSFYRLGSLEDMRGMLRGMIISTQNSLSIPRG